MEKGHMEHKDLAAVLEHMVVHQTATEKDVLDACAMALELGIRSLAVAPTYAAIAAKQLAGSTVELVSMVGYPHGTGLTEVKAYEVSRLMDMRVREIDMVMNMSRFKSGEISEVAHDIAGVATPVEIRGGRVKVIIETELLDAAELETACRIARDARAWAVMTSSGCSTAGVTKETISRIRAAIGDSMHIHVSGGIRTLADAQAALAAGADTIGTSATASIFEELKGSKKKP